MPWARSRDTPVATSASDSVVQVLVDLVLEVEGQYWRIRGELVALPTVGTAMQVFEEVEATVVGSTSSAVTVDGGRRAVAAVLIRATGLYGLDGRLRHAGWQRLL